MILDGKALSKKLEENQKQRVKNLKHKHTLAIFQVGDDYSSSVYVKMKLRAAAEIGLDAELFSYKKDAGESDVIAKIKYLCASSDVCGIMVQHPLPKSFDEDKILAAITPEKDVDGLSEACLAKISLNLPCFAPATALAVMTILKEYNINVAGKHAVIVGRSRIVGKPLAYLLTNADATVTLAHSKTQNLEELLSLADIVVVAIGKPNFIKASCIKEGAVVVDTGYNPGNVGDIDFEGLEDRFSAYTPVPGGVGPMTIRSLLENCILSAEKSERVLN